MAGPRRRRFWRSLRWRLTLSYVGLLAVLLLVLGSILLITVNQLLSDAANRNFAVESQAAATARNATYVAAVFQHDAQGNCPTSFADAFQRLMSDPLTQAPAQFRTVVLVDRATGAVLAPLANNGEVPPALQKAQLQALSVKIGKKLWTTAVAQGTSVTYPQTFQGKPGAVTLIAYNYRIVTSCADHTSVTYPAVLMMTRDFSTTQGTIDSFKILLVISVGLLFVLGLAIGIPLTSASLAPLSRVTATARKLAGGDLTQRVRLSQRHDEVGELAQSFDEMAEEMERSFAEQQRAAAQVRQFTNDAAHELRSPITAIAGCLEILERHGYADRQEVERLSTLARQETARVGRLVNDLLTLARFDAGRPLELIWTDLAELVRGAVEQVRLSAGPRTVLAERSGDACLALVDPDRLKQVVLIVLDNALKYGRQDAEGTVRTHVHGDGQAVTITIQDNGPGIDSGALPHIFDRFFRDAEHHPGVGGSGLGLAIARAIVTAHGGTIAVESVPEGGTRFTLRLPVDGPVAAEAALRPTRPLASRTPDLERMAHTLR